MDSTNKKMENLKLTDRDIFKLRGDHLFKDDKIKISYSSGDISSQLSVYLFDQNRIAHHVYWNIHPDRCLQSFDAINFKVKKFVFNKVSEWIKEQDEQDELRKQIAQNKFNKEKRTIKSLIDNF